MCAVCNPAEIHEIPSDLDHLGTQVKAAQDELDNAWHYVRNNNETCAILHVQAAWEELTRALGLPLED